VSILTDRTAGRQWQSEDAAGRKEEGRKSDRCESEGSIPPPPPPPGRFLGWDFALQTKTCIPKPASLPKPGDKFCTRHVGERDRRNRTPYVHDCTRAIHTAPRRRIKNTEKSWMCPYVCLHQLKLARRSSWHPIRAASCQLDIGAWGRLDRSGWDCSAAECAIC